MEKNTKKIVTNDKIRYKEGRKLIKTDQNPFDLFVGYGDEINVE